MLLYLLYTWGHEYRFESYSLLLFHYLYSWLFLTIILHTQFSLNLNLKPFLSLHIYYKIRFKSKIHTRKDENTSKDEEKQEESLLFIKIGRKSYSLLLFSLIFILLVTKHYSTYTLFTAFVSKTFFSIQITHKIRFELKLNTREDEERWNARKNEKSSSVHPKGPFVVLVRDFNSIC